MTLSSSGVRNDPYVAAHDAPKRLAISSASEGVAVWRVIAMEPLQVIVAA